MRATPGTALRVGVVVAATVALFMATVWVLGQQTKLFSRKVHYLTRFRNVAGLEQGSDVRLVGYRIGHIEEIRLPENMVTGLIEVELAVEEESTSWIRTDTEARVKTLGLLGDRYIELAGGDPAKPKLPPGGEIRTVQPIDTDALLASGENIADNLLVTTSELNKVLLSINNGEGVLGELLKGSERTSQIVDDIGLTLHSASDIAGRINKGEGAVGLLTSNNPRAREFASDLTQLVSGLRQVSDKLNTGEGPLPRALRDPQFMAETLDHLNAATKDIAEFSNKLNSSEGVIGRLVTDKDYGDEVLDSLKRASSSMAKLSEGLAQGEGTLGKLMVDETLYEGLNDILAGAHKSRLTRWVLTRSQKMGAEDRLKEEQAKPTAKEKKK